MADETVLFGIYTKITHGMHENRWRIAILKFGIVILRDVMFFFWRAKRKALEGGFIGCFNHILP